MCQPPDKHLEYLELVKLAFPAVGALWLFYGVTLLGLMKQFQERGPLLRWSRFARRALWFGVVGFLLVNLVAVTGMQMFLCEMAKDAGLSFDAAYERGLWVLVVLHASIDCACAIVVGHALGLGPRARVRG
ncbi:MAG: hypothetical protein ACHP84_03355 [Caulobacterales bacterium]